jgi:hypothetical protein
VPGLLAQACQGGQLGEMAAGLAAHLADGSRCGVLVATLAEEMPVQETLELLDRLRRGPGTRPVAVVANGLYPPLPRDRAGPSGQDLWTARRRMNEAELERLAGAWDGPLLELPLLPLDRGPELVAALAAAWTGADR